MENIIEIFEILLIILFIGGLLTSDSSHGARSAGLFMLIIDALFTSKIDRRND